MSYLRMAIVCRKDLCMPTGKFGAMVAHVSMSFILSRLQIWKDEFWPLPDADISARIESVVHGLKFNATQDEIRWLTELDPGQEDKKQVSMAKIVLEVHSFQELKDVEAAAHEHKLNCHPLYDSGHSHNKPGEFVAIAIGPHWPEQLAPVTGHLKVYR